jgi:hypothetical protein
VSLDGSEGVFLRRSRPVYLIAASLVVVMGLASRRYAADLPSFLARYAGDTLWAATVFVLIGVLRARWPTGRVAAAALATSYGVEISQLYHAPWIDAVRATRLGALVLGYGFLWSDVACYTVGVAICVALERASAGLTREAAPR